MVVSLACQSQELADERHSMSEMADGCEEPFSGDKLNRRNLNDPSAANRLFSRQQDLPYGGIQYMGRRFISGLFYFRLFRVAFKGSPYYAPGAIWRLRSLVNDRSCIFEWGSGASTTWYARRAAKVSAVEHDATWYEKGLQLNTLQGIRNVELIFCPRDDAEQVTAVETEWEYFRELGHEPARPGFVRYMAAIESWSDESLDGIAIDGRERIGCLMHARRKLKPGGFLVLDDSNRNSYREAFSILKKWQCSRHKFGLLETSIFIKPDKRVFGQGSG